MTYSNDITDGIITVYFDVQIFTKEAILKCLYWYGDKFSTTIAQSENGKQLIVKLKAIDKDVIPDSDLQAYMQKLERDAIDFQLRQVVQSETQNIRDILVAKAFSNGEFDEAPPGNVSDPVGFEPQSI